MKLTLIRHGETPDNIQKIWPYDETSLNETGVQQSRKLAERLKGKEFHYIYSSPMVRAVQTAEFALEYHSPYDLLSEDRLADLNVGNFKGQPITSFKHTEDFGMVPPSGESINNLFDRVQSFYEYLLEGHRQEEEQVAVFSHTSPIRILTGLVLGLSLNDVYFGLKKPKNTSVTEFLINEDGLYDSTISMNCIKHLE